MKRREFLPAAVGAALVPQVVSSKLNKTTRCSSMLLSDHICNKLINLISPKTPIEKVVDGIFLDYVNNPDSYYNKKFKEFKEKDRKAIRDSINRFQNGVVDACRIYVTYDEDLKDDGYTNDKHINDALAKDMPIISKHTFRKNDKAEGKKFLFIRYKEGIMTSEDFGSEHSKFSFDEVFILSALSDWSKSG